MKRARDAVITMAKSTSGKGGIILSAIGWGLLGSYIGVMTWGCERSIRALASGLDESQADLFRRIVRKRKSITLWAMIISLAPALGVLSLCKSSIGIALFVWLGLTMLIYLIWPKGPYMLDSIMDPTQASQWLSICICMRTRALIGFISGMLIFVAFVYLTRPLVSKRPLTTCDIING